MKLDKVTKSSQPEEVHLSKRIGQAIKDYRRKSVNQTELAQGIGTVQPTVSKWEAGSQRPSLEEIYSIESYLGLTHGTLLSAAGLVDRPAAFDLVVASDESLDQSAKSFVTMAYRGAQRDSAERRRTRPKAGKQRK